MFRSTTMLVVLLVAASTAHAQLDDDPRAARPPAPRDIAELAERFLPHYEPFGISGVADLAQSEVRTFSQAVDPGVCYAVAAVAADGTDIDVRVRRAGHIVAQDVSLDSYPIVEWCPTSSGTDTVAIKAFTGAAHVEYAVFVDPDTRAAAVGELDELSNRLVAHVAGSAPRWTPVGVQWRSAFTTPGEQSMAVQIPGGSCIAVAAAGQTTISDIDLLMIDEDGAELSRDFALDATPLVAYCADRPRQVEVKVAVRTGRGVVAAQLLEQVFN